VGPGYPLSKWVMLRSVPDLTMPWQAITLIQACRGVVTRSPGVRITHNDGQHLVFWCRTRTKAAILRGCRLRGLEVQDGVHTVGLFSL
jgi:hypothetical protein